MIFDVGSGITVSAMPGPPVAFDQPTQTYSMSGPPPSGGGTLTTLRQTT